MRLLKRIPECDRLPRGYGIAWRSVETAHAVCAPIGLHWILGMVRWCYYIALRSVRPARFEMLLHENGRLYERCEYAEQKLIELRREHDSLTRFTARLLEEVRPQEELQ